MLLNEQVVIVTAGSEGIGWECSKAYPIDQTLEQYGQIDDIHPLGDCPEGDAIADPCVFLLSNMARFITGHILRVSGGAEIGYRFIGGDNHVNQAG